VTSRPNIVVVCTDQHRFDAVGYVSDHVSTPTLDRLAAEGTVFERCYTTSPVCSPSRASMMTGKFPHAHGLWANGVTLPGGSPLLSRLLADAGYRCGLVGRWHLSATAEGRTEPRQDDGFSSFVWADAPDQESPENAYHRWLEREFPELWAEREGNGEHPFADLPAEAHFTRWAIGEALEFVGGGDDDGEAPFFLVVNLFDPHHPFTAPAEQLERYRDVALPDPVRPPVPEDGTPPLHGLLASGLASPAAAFRDLAAGELDEIRRSYLAMVSHLDAELARLVARLDESGAAQDTLVIVTSDHGEMLGDHGQLLKGPLFYEPAVRVPLVMRWPGRIASGGRCDELVQGVDLFATCLAAADVEPSLATVSRDLVAISEGSARGRGFALCEYRDSARPLDPPVLATMLLKDGLKLVVYHSSGPGGDPTGELYDLADDPDELVNLWHEPRYETAKSVALAALVEAFVITEDRSAPRLAPW
jgi:arylsulfatase A-like enzyme